MFPSHEPLGSTIFYARQIRINTRLGSCWGAAWHDPNVPASPSISASPAMYSSMSAIRSLLRAKRTSVAQDRNDANDPSETWLGKFAVTHKGAAHLMVW